MALRFLLVGEPAEMETTRKAMKNYFGGTARIDIVLNEEEVCGSVDEDPPPDLVVVDVDTRRINGIRTTKRILDSGYRGTIVFQTISPILLDNMDPTKVGATEIIPKTMGGYSFCKRLDTYLNSGTP